MTDGRNIFTLYLRPVPDSTLPGCLRILPNRSVNVSPLQQTSLSLSSEQPPPSTALPAASQTQVFQPVSKAPHSSGINVNAAPFQSMQTVRPL